MEQGLRPKRAECLVFYKCIRLACSIANQSLGLKTRKDYRNGGLNVRAGGNGSRTRGRINFSGKQIIPFFGPCRNEVDEATAAEFNSKTGGPIHGAHHW